jgi:hypothetical protein
MGAMTNTHEILVGKSDERDHCKNLSEAEGNIKINLAVK